MIKCKEDLINTYIENDHGELRDLYIKKAIELGFGHQGYLDRKVDWYSLGFIGICSGWNDDRLGQTDYDDEMLERLKCKKLTLSDLKPRTRTEYEKVTESIFDLRDEFERGELYRLRKDDIDGYVKITNLKVLVEEIHGCGIFRLVEKEIDWRDEVSDFVIKNKITYSCNGHRHITAMADYTDEQFLELCRVALRANGEIE